VYAPTAQLQEEAAETLIRRSGFGTDNVPDLLTVFLGGRQGPDSQAETIAENDEALGYLTRFLRQQLDPGRFALVVTSDGGMPDGTAIRDEDIAAAIDESFGPVTQAVSGGQVFIDTSRFEGDASTSTIAAALRALKMEDLVGGGGATPLFALATESREIPNFTCPISL
jgi:hypothetical protein